MVTGATLKYLVEVAYDLHDFQIQAPGWINSARFDIIAKVIDPAHTPDGWDERQDLLRIRLKSLLADRFQLQAHPIDKTLPVYGLVVAKPGPKLRPSTTDTGYTAGRGLLACTNTPMAYLASMLSDQLDRIVLDQTHMDGGYAFTLHWTPDDTTDTNNVYPGLTQALQDQLGLKLVPARGPVPVLSIDHIAMPSDN
jgi:uncharacterized protein (TIGR03435 family)